MSEENRTVAVSEAVWSEQEKERRSKFSWLGRRMEDGRIVFSTTYAIGGVILAAAIVLIPWVIGVRALWGRFFG